MRSHAHDGVPCHAPLCSHLSRLASIGRASRTAGCHTARRRSPPGSHLATSPETRHSRPIFSPRRTVAHVRCTKTSPRRFLRATAVRRHTGRRVVLQAPTRNSVQPTPLTADGGPGAARWPMATPLPGGRPHSAARARRALQVVRRGPWASRVRRPRRRVRAPSRALVKKKRATACEHIERHVRGIRLANLNFGAAGRSFRPI